MHTKKLWLLAAMMILLLAACGGGAEPATVETEAEPETAVVDEAMDDEEMMEESMDDEAMDDEEMMEESMDDEAMAEHDDEAMDDEAMDDEAMADEAMDDEAMADEAMDDEAMADEAMDDEAMADAGDLPAWQTIALTNAATGETFTLADFAGKTVFVEPMATWCTNCRRQLGDVAGARASVGDDVVFIALSVETSLDDPTLAQYAANNGYDWTFAVMSAEMVQALAGEFGQSVLNPPSTPHFIISPDGSFTDVETGFESADELIMQIEAASS